MNIIKKLALTFFMAISLSASNVAFAEDAAASATIAHIEEALVEVGKADFNSAQAHLKAARTSSDQITGNEAAVKQGYQCLVRGQILGKSADAAKTTVELNKALGFYKSI